MKYIFSIILISLALNTFAQKSRLEMKIEKIDILDTITIRHFQHVDATVKTDTINERKFTITYHLKNTSDATVRFFYNAELNDVKFKIYQDNKIVAAFLVKEWEHKTQKYYLGAPPEKDEEVETVTPIPTPPEEEPIQDTSWPDEEMLRNSVFTLSPGQEWQFTQVYYWNKNQPNRKQNNQGYVDPGFNHYIELRINLQKHFYRRNEKPSGYDKILDDKNFLEDEFISEKA